MSRLVCGIGFNDNKYLARIGGKMLKEYEVWGKMLLRCTEKCWTTHPSYLGTTCSENFKDYTFFYEWCQEQIGFNNKDEYNKSWQLDKDLLFIGNKHYSETTCVFVPHRINSLLTKSDGSRGGSPIGVSWHKSTSKYAARSHLGNGKSKHLGLFSEPEDAFQAYKTFKESLIKEVANKYKDQLDHRVYNALMKYEVNIND